MPLSELGQFTVGAFHRDVLYVNQKLQSISEGQLNPYIEEIPPVFRPVFVKPEKYALDREYRFLFTIEHRQHSILSVRDQPIDIPVMPVRSI